MQTYFDALEYKGDGWWSEKDDRSDWWIRLRLFGPIFHAESIEAPDLQSPTSASSDRRG